MFGMNELGSRWRYCPCKTPLDEVQEAGSKSITWSHLLVKTHIPGFFVALTMSIKGKLFVRLPGGIR